MKDFNFEEWLLLIHENHEKISKNINELYQLKDDLDKELSVLFVEKVSKFYQSLLALYDVYSLEAPEPMIFLKKEFAKDLKSYINNYSELLFFKSVIEGLMNIKINYPENYGDKLWIELKHKYIKDFVEGVHYENEH